MKKMLRFAVENENEGALEEYLGSEKIKEDISEYPYFEQALLGTWHSQHEDLVNTIYLHDLKDDRFVEPILNIAFNEEVYRWYDDESEPTLRKCVHALKTINSMKSRQALEKLKALKNENIEITLDMYR